MDVTRERLEARKAELDAEAERGIGRLAALEAELEEARGAMANIHGARMVLAELIAETQDRPYLVDTETTA